MKISPTVRASLELLGVELSAGPAELKKSYHRLALLYHPDRNQAQSAIAEFRKITEAYDLLCDRPRVEDLNRRYMRERLHRPVIEGIEITFGSFFGYRIFRPGADRAAVRALLKGTVSEGSQSREAESWGPIEENNSILDHAAFDAIEVVYAGRISGKDEERLKGQIGRSELGQLPWVLLNNQGLLRFLDGDLKGAEKCYRELCERIPNNIIFLYRYGLCLILDGFRNPQRTLLGGLKPDRIKIEKGLKLLEHCLKLGRERPVGRQKCMVIRKVMADVLEKTGRSRKARILWREILEEDPQSAEATAKVKGLEEARQIIKRKQKRDAIEQSVRQLNSGQVSKVSTLRSKPSPEDLV